MAVELDHPFSTARPIDDSYATILDLERVVPCVEGGSVLERTGPTSVKAEIKVKMGAMSMTFTGTRRDRRAGRGGPPRGDERQVDARPAARGTPTPPSPSRSPTAAATIHTNAQITGKAASMGEGVVAGVLDALITDFAGKLGAALSHGRWRRSRCGRSARARCRRDGGTARAGGPRPPGLPRQRPGRLRLRRVRQRPGRVDGRRADDVEGARALRPLRTVNVAAIDGYERSQLGRAERPRATLGAARTRRRRRRPAPRSARRGGWPIAGAAEVAQRVVVGALALHAAEAEALGRQAARERRRSSRTSSRHSARCSSRSKPSAASAGYSSSAAAGTR